MNSLIHHGIKHQRGAATLLIALVLMMAVTVLTLSVARTGINQGVIDINQQWRDRLFITAESAIESLLPRIPTLSESEWRPVANSNEETWQQSDDDSRIETELEITRSPLPRRFVTVQAATRRSDGSGPGVQVTRQFRRLSILSPLAEQAPPLIIQGCPTATFLNDEIYPLNADNDSADDAIWLTGRTCPSLDIDTHQGAIQTKLLPDELWNALVTVDREAYAELVDQEQTLPPGQRRYWVATPTDLDSQGLWSRSIGSADRHQFLYFPPETGCPGFAAGVRIYGVVFIDVACTNPLTLASLDIYGTLIIKGNLNIGPGSLRLANIQLEDAEQTALWFPTLRHIRVPGTWRDF
ncbi:hypothetical protein MNBD_GAMMA15-755 [hydrothermal vent metagenome]|uniref:Type 4 fimbrial biogenesis protein PilX N-terminal domain-containing protein n=1 Tax=hydrothermal vent metagenome TaxID=652676 RepID=A0A3B0ZFB3_9ZZZZ